MSLFRSLAFGMNAPPNSVDPAGCVLWFRLKITGHVRVEAEFPFAHLDESQLASEVFRIESAKHLGPIEYTVADPDLFAKSKLPGMVGQYVSDRLATAGIPIIPSDPDLRNGWARLQSLLSDSPTGTPWLIFSPECPILIKHLGQAMTDATRRDDLSDYSAPLTALRFGVMALPPLDVSNSEFIEPPFGSPAWFMRREWSAAGRRFGQTR